MAVVLVGICEWLVIKAGLWAGLGNETGWPHKAMVGNSCLVIEMSGYGIGCGGCCVVLVACALWWGLLGWVVWGWVGFVVGGLACWVGFVVGGLACWIPVANGISFVCWWFLVADSLLLWGCLSCWVGLI